MEVAKKRLLVQLAALVALNGAVFGISTLPLFLPVLQCLNLRTKTIGCNIGILQRNLSLTWFVSSGGALFDLLCLFLPLAAIGTVILVGAVFGRALCGWICPLGLCQDLLGFVPRLFRKKQREFSQRTHKILTGIKYVVLYIVIVIVVSMGVIYFVDRYVWGKISTPLGICGKAPFCLICPVPALFITIPALASGLLHGSLPPLPLTSYIQLAFLAFFLSFSILVKRSWCRYVCPSGALMSFFNKFSLLHIRKKANKCTTFCRGHQRDCNQTCPMGIQVSRNQEPSSNPECILCYNCVESCSNKAAKYKLG